MGLFWDLIQQDQIEQQQAQADTLEERVQMLEAESERTRSLLLKTLHVLEEHIGKDIDGDGVTG